MTRLSSYAVLVAGVALLWGVDVASCVGGVLFAVPNSEIKHLAAVVGLRWGGLGIVATIGALTFARRRPNAGIIALSAVAASAVSAACVTAVTGASSPSSWTNLLFLVLAPLIASLLAAALAARTRATLWATGATLAYSAIRLGPLLEFEASSPTSVGPDMLLITLDTCRSDAFSWSRRPIVEDLTETLDAAVGDSGVCRMEATAPAPLTGPSHAALLSGRHPIELGLLLNGRVLPSDIPSLPETLRSKGYRTAAFVSSAMLDAGLGYARGFDIYDDDLSGEAAFEASTWAFLQAPRSARQQRHEAFERAGPATEERFVQYLREQSTGGAPLFVWLHLYDAHGPYRPTEASLAAVREEEVTLPPASAYREHAARPPAPPKIAPDVPFAPIVPKRSLSRVAERDGATPTGDPMGGARRYLGEVRDVTEIAARALRTMEEKRNRPLVWAIVGDHGESLTEHNEIGSHQRNVYEANLRVPLFLPPARNGQCPAEPLSTAGLAGSLLARADLPLEGFPSLAGEADDAFPVVSAVLAPEHHGRRGRVRQVAVRDGDWKLVRSAPRQPRDGWTEYYDLATDPHEISPVAPGAVPADTRAALDALAADWIAKLDARPAEQPASVDVRKALEALGYVE